MTADTLHEALRREGQRYLADPKAVEADAQQLEVMALQRPMDAALLKRVAARLRFSVIP